METEAENFDCEACPVAQHLDGMDADNKRAWDLVQMVCSRLLFDGQAVGAVLIRLLSDLDAEEFEDMLKRVTLIYDVLVPRPQPSR